MSKTSDAQVPVKVGDLTVRHVIARKGDDCIYLGFLLSADPQRLVRPDAGRFPGAAAAYDRLTKTSEGVCAAGYAMEAVDRRPLHLINSDLDFSAADDL